MEGQIYNIQDTDMGYVLSVLVPKPSTYGVKEGTKEYINIINKGKALQKEIITGKIKIEYSE